MLKCRILSKDFWERTLMRALKTGLQTIAGVWTAGQLITEINWKITLIAAGSAALYSILTSIIAGLPEVEENCELEEYEGDNEFELEIEEEE